MCDPNKNIIGYGSAGRILIGGTYLDLSICHGMEPCITTQDTTSGSVFLTEE